MIRYTKHNLYLQNPPAFLIMPSQAEMTINKINIKLLKKLAQFWTVCELYIETENGRVFQKHKQVLNHHWNYFVVSDRYDRQVSKYWPISNVISLISILQEEPSLRQAVNKRPHSPAVRLYDCACRCEKCKDSAKTGVPTPDRAHWWWQSEALTYSTRLVLENITNTPIDLKW